MGHWMGDTRLNVDTFVLKRTGVSDIEDFVAHHDHYLVSIRESPKDAAHWWRWQSDKIYPCEGWISMRLNDTEIMPLDAWTNIDLFWDYMLGALEMYVSTGEGLGEFSEEIAGFSITKKESIALFELRGYRYPVEPRSFVTGLLEGARKFCVWRNQYVGTNSALVLERIHAIEDKLQTS